ncbi:MAG: F0F1 ATP synthase subunit A [Pirellulales bacterium]|nr:F0F1 ATP synthase subunit A [Pirellulales bacterium]
MASDTSELISHVKDTDAFHFPRGYHWEIPQPFEALGLPLHLTKFMVLELVVAVLLIVIFVPFARRVARGGPPRGRLHNALEAILLFLRNEVARPAIGAHDADRFLPFIWTIFFFILFCNLAGMVPWAGSPTGALGCTGALAVTSLVVMIGSGMRKYGPVRFWIGQVPHMDLPLVMAVLIKPMIFGIEVFGMLIKHFVLSVRLLANMFAGHLVLGVIVGFIALTADRNLALWTTVTVSSVFGAVAISLLELFVAFLQAYIFAFLSAIFIGMAVHQH